MLQIQGRPTHAAASGLVIGLRFATRDIGFDET